MSWAILEWMGCYSVGIGKSLAVFSAFAEGVSLYSAFAVLYSFQLRNLLKGIGQQPNYQILQPSLKESVCILLLQCFIVFSFAIYLKVSGSKLSNLSDVAGSCKNAS